MKRFLLLCLMTLFSLTTWAQWGTDYDFRAENDDGYTIWYDIVESEDYEYACEVAYRWYEESGGYGDAPIHRYDRTSSDKNITTYSILEGYMEYDRIDVPSTVVNDNDGNTYTVIGLGEYAFSGCSALESVTLPSTLLYIGASAFEACDALTEITLPDGLTTIGDYAFVYDEMLEKVNVPGTVINVGEGIFESCTNLSNVTLGEGLTTIGVSMFSSCRELTTIEFPSTITTIGDNAFKNASLTAIHLPANCKTVGSYAFYDNMEVAELTLPDGLEYIGDYAFYQIFSYITDDDVVLTIPESVTYLGSYAFYHCTNMKQLYILGNIEEIKASTFYQSTYLTTVSIPKTVTSIGGSAFYNSTRVTSFTCLNHSVPTCGSNVFSSSMMNACTLYVPESSVDNYTKADPWGNFFSIVGIEVEDDGEPDEDETRFVEDDIYYQIIDADAMTVEVTFESTAYNYYTGDVEVPATVTHNDKEYAVIGIGENAFRYSPSMTSVSLPESITYLGEYSFYNCSALATITFPSGISEISTYAFYGCTLLTSLYFPSNITTIDSHAFYGCTALTELSIPATVTFIGGYAFSYCSKLNILTFEDGEEPLSFGNSNYTFYGSPITSVYIGRNLDYDTSAYLHSPLAYFTTLKNISISENITSLGDYLFIDDGFEELTFPNWITDIGECLFEGCSSLKSITMSDGCTKMGDYMFLDCSGLKEINLPATLTDLGQYAFAQTGIEEVTIPGTITSGGYCFQNCSSLKKVTFEEGFTTVFSGMFQYCSALTDVSFPSTLKSTGRNSFYSCTSLKKVILPEGVTSAGGFEYCTSLTEILFPQSLTSFSYIDGCSSLKSIIVPKLITEMGAELFDGCTNLEEAIILGPIETYSYYIFRNCSSMKRLYSLVSTPPVKDSGVGVSTKVFTGLDTDTCILYVPAGAKEAYENDDLWGVFANIEELGEPLAITYGTTALTTDYAEITGYIAVGTVDVEEVGFEYWTDDDEEPTLVATSTSDIATGSISLGLDKLGYGLNYTYRAYAKTANGTIYGDELEFSMPIDGSRAITLDATAITETSAVLNGRLVLTDDDSVTEQGFVYWEEANANKKEALIIDLDTWTYTLESLSPETTYAYYAFAVLDGGETLYGEDVEFTTLEDTTTGITNVGAYGIDGENIEGYYTPDGRALNAPQPGVNIIRYTDGTTKKVLVK